MSNRFFIIVTGYNCEAFVKKCYESLFEQTYSNWHTVFINDASTDNTQDIIEGLKCKHITNKTNIGASYGRNFAIKNFAAENDIILFLGMDDHLLPNALERINKEYKNGKLMTYGNWINQFGTGLPESFDLDFDDETHANRNYRNVTYRSTAPNTFRKFLYNCITEDELKYENEWLKVCTEGPVMFAMLEQCGKDRIGVIKDKIYHYNESTNGMSENSHNGTLKRYGFEYKYKVYRELVARNNKKELYESK